MAAQSEDDLFALAAKAGNSEAKEGIPDGRVFLEQAEVDLGFETRVKAPTKKAATKPEKPRESEKRPLARGSRGEKEAADIAETLEQKTAEMFSLLIGVAPVTSVYAVDNSPKAIRALVDIGKRRPAVMKALQMFANGADGVEIGRFLLGVVIALQVDFGKLRGDELPARAFGITAILEEHFTEDSGPSNPGMTGQALYGQQFTPVS